MKHFLTLILLAIAIPSSFVYSASTIAATKTDNHDNSFVAPVDMSNLVSTLEWYNNSNEKSKDSILVTKLIPVVVPNDNDAYKMGIIYCSTAPVNLPACNESKHVFLSSIQDIYNSSVTSYNIMSNLELWHRIDDNDSQHSINHAFQSYNANYIKDKSIREATAQLINRAIELTSGKDVDDIYDLDKSLANIISNAYKFPKPSELEQTKLQEYVKKFTKLGNKGLERYINCSSNEKIKVILHELSECKTFDEQCSLWMLWAQNLNSFDEEIWLLGTAHCLLNSNKYAANLNMIWEVWRAMQQVRIYGQSSYSFIPNDYYNSVRNKCFTATINYIAANPDNHIAMSCAMAFAATPNLSRFGSIFGNEALNELHRLLGN